MAKNRVTIRKDGYGYTVHGGPFEDTYTQDYSNAKEMAAARRRVIKKRAARREEMNKSGDPPRSGGKSRSSSTSSKKKHNPINYGSKKEVTYGHAITHAKGYQKGVGTSTARKEHDRAARVMREEYGVQHHTPFKAKVRRR